MKWNWHLCQLAPSEVALRRGLDPLVGVGGHELDATKASFL